MDEIKAFVSNIRKKIRQEAVVKMQTKMERAAENTVKNAKKYKGFDDVTGNLYKSIAVGTYYQGALQSEHFAPGADPTRPTLAKGETYNLENYYENPVPLKMMKRKPFRGRIGEGGENGPRAASDALLEHEFTSNRSTWQLIIVAGVSYANFVEKVFNHNVITDLGQYMARYFKKM